MAPAHSQSAAVGFGERLVRALAAARSDEAAVRAVLGELVTELRGRLAVLWLLDPRTGLLQWHAEWAVEDEGGELHDMNRRLTFAPGVGLPGRVLASSLPAWIEDVAVDPDFPRRDVALRAGARSAVAAPLIAQEGLIGVVEAFMPDVRGSTDEQMADALLVGQQLGFYLGRRRVADRLVASEESSASIVQAALDCIITMDHRGRVLDFNPAAEATFGYERDETIGELLAELIIPAEFRTAHHEALTDYVRSRKPRILGRRLELVGMRRDGAQFPLELTVTRVGTREPPVFAGFLRDISDRRAAEEQLGRLLEREQAERARAEHAERATRDVAEVLQRSLLPPRLPAVPGLELGAAYRAGTAGWQVGGDFYDVFKLGPARWAIVIGDVCGKGPRAAAVTAMARYALRNAAVRESSPSAVLAALNAELLEEDRGDLVTAIFATVDVSEEEPCISLAVGGHPLPLLARPDGSVATVGHPGTLLGAVESAVSHDFDVRLRPGELLLLHTDGVIEAPTQDGRFGEERLSELLAGCASEHPQEVARVIDETICHIRTEAGDDVALLALRLGGRSAR